MADASFDGAPVRQTFRVTRGDEFPKERGISDIAWFFLVSATVGTFVAFVCLDPKPNLLLAVCTAANVALILWAIYRLYIWNLLLSPITSFVIGPGWVLVYSWGNLGARMVGEGRHGSNPGSLAYYPQAALLATIGLLLFCWIVFGLFPRQIRYSAIRYQDLSWKPWQALATILFSIIIFVYLSAKYRFTGGYFREVQSHVDRWLSASHYFFVLLAVVTNVSILIKSQRQRSRVLGVLGLIGSFVVAVGLRSRTFMMTVTTVAVICWITLKPKQTRAVLYGAGLVAVILFICGTIVKEANVRGASLSIWGNIVLIADTNFQGALESNLQSFELDYQYRLAGLEYPAAILCSLDRGAPVLYGEAAWGGLLSGFPGFLRDQLVISERLVIYRHFSRYELLEGDSIGIPLTSGLADWGRILGPLVYVAVALYCLVIWRVAQLSPRLFITYLIVFFGRNFDLFWEGIGFIIKGMVFAWVALWLLGPILMPRWDRDTGQGQDSEPCPDNRLTR